MPSEKVFRGRPKKVRLVKKEPVIRQFSPRGKPGRPDEVELDCDGFEAVRLADLLNLSQKDSAERMNISQQTFSRIVQKARRAIADAVVNGKILRIGGGKYLVQDRGDNEKRVVARRKRFPGRSAQTEARQTMFSFLETPKA